MTSKQMWIARNKDLESLLFKCFHQERSAGLLVNGTYTLCVGLSESVMCRNPQSRVQIHCSKKNLSGDFRVSPYLHSPCLNFSCHIMICTCMNRTYEMDLRTVMYFYHFWVCVAIRTNIFYRLYKFLLYDMLYKQIFHLSKY